MVTGAMKKVLFINACIRNPGKSRTYQLCRTFLDEYADINPGFSLDEVDLTKMTLPFFDDAAITRRDRLIDMGKTDSTIFRYAKQFALADRIVIGAPYWDLSFPAILKAYVEHISCRDITFRNTPTGIAGLCNAEKLVYITAVGGYIEHQANLGAEYIQSLCKIMYGIELFEAVYAEGLDIEPNDPAEIMRDAVKKAKLAARRF